MRPQAAVAPGSWTVVRATGLLALLADDASDALVDACRAVAGSGDLDDLLDELLAGGLRSVPDVAAAAWDDAGSVRVVVRGAARVVVRDGEGTEQTVLPAGARPWRDLDVDDVAWLALLAPGTEVADAVLDGEPAAPERAAVAPVAAAWPLPPSLAAPAGTAEVTASDVVPEPVGQPGGQPAGQPVAAERTDDEPAVSYDFLFGATERGLDLGGVPAPAAPAAPAQPVERVEPPPAGPDPVTGPPAGRSVVDLTLPPPTGDQPEPSAPAAAAPAPEPAGQPAAQPAPASPPPLISQVPWRRSEPDAEPQPAAATPAPPSSAPPPPPPAAPATTPVPVQHVALPTRPQPVPPPAPAAVTPAAVTPAATPAPPAAEAPSRAADDDHEVDEATVDRAALLAERPLTGPEVLAVLCPAGHPSPAHATRCRVCGRDVPAQTPYRTPRPPLGVLTLSTGDVVTLDRGVLLGRAPTLAGNASLGERPHVVKVASPDKDISRNHAQLALEGWHVLVSDLGSTNGTTVQLPGQDPVRLRPGDQQQIEPGTVVVLADEVSLVYEVTA